MSIEEEEQITIPGVLALRLSAWHDSMSCPCYAVSSSGMAGRPVPRSVFECARDKMKRCLDDDGFEENRMEILEITNHMDSALGEGQVMEQVIHSFARSMWAIIWAEESDTKYQNGEIDSSYPGGSQLLHIAPQTPESIRLGAHLFLIRMSNKCFMSIPKIVKLYRNDPYFHSVHDFGHELAMAAMGTGSELDFDKHGIEMPYLETSYYEYEDTFKGYGED